MIKNILVVSTITLFTSCALIPIKNLPDPKGDFIIGTEVFNWEDTSRDEWFTKDKIDSRKIVVQVWYPAETKSDSIYPYMANADVRIEAISKQIGVPKSLMKKIKTIEGNSYFKAPPLKNKIFPIVIFSHGLGGHKTQNSINIEELVSQGYVVVAPDHTYDANVTIFEDGTTIDFQSGLEDDISEQEFWDNRLPQVNTRAGDIKFIIDILQTMKNNNLYKILDFDKIGVFGHSFGGATSIIASWNDSRVKACLNLDGWFVPIVDEIINTGLKIPFCYIGLENWINTPQNYEKVYNFFNNCQSDSYFIKVKNTKHFDYADLPYFSKIGKVFGATGKDADYQLTLNLNQVILGFFNEYLKNDVNNWTLNLTENYDTIVKFK